MNALKSGPVLAILTFFFTLIGLVWFNHRTSSSQEFTFFLKNPQKIETPDLVAYTLDRVDGPAKDLTFRCNITTGEGYFSLKSEGLSWASSHCQDMVGAVKDIEEKKKTEAVVHVVIAEQQVSYQVKRN